METDSRGEGGTQREGGTLREGEGVEGAIGEFAILLTILDPVVFRRHYRRLGGSVVTCIKGSINACKSKDIFLVVFFHVPFISGKQLKKLYLLLVVRTTTHHRGARGNIY